MSEPRNGMFPAALQLVDDHTLIAVEHDGLLYVGTAAVICPRSDEELGLQAFNEMQDAGELDTPGTD